MAPHSETNPYFGTQQNQEQHSQLARSRVATPSHEHQQNQTLSDTLMPLTQYQNQIQPSGSQITPPEQTRSQLQPQFYPPTTGTNTSKPMGPWRALADKRQNRPRAGPQATQQPSGGPERTGARVIEPKHQDQHAQSQSQSQSHSPQEQHQTREPKHQDQYPQSQSHSPQGQDHHLHGQRQDLSIPPTRKTTLPIWFLAGFCAIFWVVIILGGLIVLIVYLIFRPHSPRFDVPSVTLNAAYLDVDALLNADITVLAKFTNPNKKVRVDFSYVVLDLYYGSTLIASQYIEPFRALRAESKLANVHMVTSQVRLPLAETQRLKTEIGRNAVVFEVKGVFRARSDLGSFLRYSYWLYGHCTIVVTGPPSGVVKGSRCKTKR